ncbi:MAG TPA: hypothetical protein VG407_18220 [Caulobacteraceae bacterium]|jgi:hypothetical protein|nr:hypothetical protein [Caulobacteraceae bacterium]
MDIHKPKAVSSLKELAVEIGVIVIGVVIALGAEQAVDAWRWHDQAEAGQAALSENFGRVVNNAYELEAEHDCVAARLTLLGGIIEKAADAGRLPALGDPGRPPFSPWRNNVWPGLVAAQLATHLPRDKAVAYANIATISDYLADLSDQELDQWQTLSTVVGHGRRLSDVEAETLRLTVARARFSADKMLSSSRIVLGRIRATGLVSEGHYTASAKRAQALRAQAAICAPMPAPRG